MRHGREAISCPFCNCTGSRATCTFRFVVAWRETGRAWNATFGRVGHPSYVARILATSRRAGSFKAACTIAFACVRCTCVDAGVAATVAATVHARTSVLDSRASGFGQSSIVFLSLAPCFIHYAGSMTEFPEFS